MHTVEILAYGMEACRRLGYQVRQEWLHGQGGGACEVKGQKVLFLDLALSPSEQLEQVLGILRGEPRAWQLVLPGELREMLQVRKIA